MKKTLVLAIVAGMLSAGADSGNGSIYYVPTSTTTVDGDTFCGGAACTSADTIIIRGGARGGLKFQDFDGAGSYITITNENTNPYSKVEIDGQSGPGCLSISNCKYIDLRGNNDGDITYGIKVINDNTSQAAGSVWIYGESDHIKISYLEITCESITTPAGNGIFVQDGTLSAAWVYDTFEIHHNYIHDTGYAGMYLGQNDAREKDDPYVATFSIHDNIMEDMGSYGITYKGVNGPDNYIYNNKVTTTGVVPGTLSDSAFHGIGVQMFYGGESYVNIYNNWIEKTVGPGLKISGSNHLIYNNVIAGCGSGNDENYGHGIVVHSWGGATKDVELYDNIAIQAYGYGIKTLGSCTNISHKRNLIGDCGIGEATGSGLVEGTGADANIYHADVADFGFKVWSDDGDYSNDVFSLGDTELTDLNGDGTVNLEDFAILAAWWDDENACLPPDWCGGADFNMNGTVNMFDLTYFAENWLRRVW